MNNQPESLGQWIEFSVPDIVLPDTFWIGLCYNYLIYPPDWYLAFDAYMTDHHTYYNSKGGPNDWLALADMGLAHPFGVRVYVTDASGIGDDGLVCQFQQAEQDTLPVQAGEQDFDSQVGQDAVKIRDI